MKTVWMKEIQCQSCPRQTRHLVPTLEEVFRYLPESAKVLQSINFACPACKHLGVVPIPIKAKMFDCPDNKQHPDDTISYLVTLGCDQQNCKLPITIFSPMEPGTSSDQANTRMNEWTYDDLTCQKGHQLAQSLRPKRRDTTLSGNVNRYSSPFSLLN
jgi:hypothetical protein